MKEVNKNKNIITEVAEYHYLPKRSISKIEKKKLEKGQSSEKEASNWVQKKILFEWFCHACANDIPFEDPPVQEKVTTLYWKWHLS